MSIKKNKIEYSLVIPCYNEEKNIPKLLKRSRKLFILKNFEMILVNNGSSDKTRDLFFKIKKIKNLRLINIKNNIGFGHGVMVGLKASRGKIIGYTHADAQTDPMDFYKGIKLIKNQKSKKIFVKGLRLNKLKYGWSLFDIFLTTSQTIFQSVLLLSFMRDIHAQPNIFSKSLLNLTKSYPKDFMIDTYFYYLAKKKKFKIEKFKVIFNKNNRGFGSGNNDTFLKKIKGIFSHITGTFVLIKIFFI